MQIYYVTMMQDKHRLLHGMEILILIYILIIWEEMALVI